MIQIIAFIYAGRRGLEGLREFESHAIPLLREHQGVLISASHSSVLHAGEPDEIHVIQFPEKAYFEAYKNDSRLQKLTSLRQSAIEKVDLYITDEFHEYA